MKMRSIRFVRRLVQWGCVLAFVAIPFLNRAEINTLSGNLLAFNFAGLPLGDPLASLQVMVSSLSVNSEMLTGLCIVLGIAFLLGPVFCSWLCPYGLLSELVHKSGRRKGESPVEGEGASGASGDFRDSPKTDAARSPASRGRVSATPFRMRLLIVAAGLALVALVAPIPILSQLSMPGWFTRFWQHVPLDSGMLWIAPVMISGVLLLEFLLQRRIWCRYLCPQSVLISLAGLLFPKRLQVAFKARSCTCPAKDRVCGKACSLELDPRRPVDVAQRLQCTNCGDCVDACRERGRALSLRFGRPTGKG